MLFPMLADATAGLQETTGASTGRDWGTALTILITGIVVVFSVLLLLIILIKLYGTIVYKAQNRAPKAPKGDNGGTVNASVNSTNSGAAMAATMPLGLTDELIAVITAAAVACFPGENIRVTGIRKRSGRSEWSNASVIENTKPFRMGDWK